MELEEIRQLATIRLWPDAGELLGLSKNSTYAAAKNGEIPTLRIGSKWLVPVAPFLRMLGIDGPMRAEIVPNGSSDRLAADIARQLDMRRKNG